MIATPALVLAKQHVDITRIDVTTLPRAFIAQCIANAGTQLLIDPLLDGNAKALLGPMENLIWNQAGNRPLQDMFCFQTSELQR